MSALPLRQLAVRLLRSDSLLLSHSLSPSLSPHEEEALETWRRNGHATVESERSDPGAESEGEEEEETEREQEREEEESEEERERRERREAMERLKEVFRQYDVSKMIQ